METTCITAHQTFAAIGIAAAKRPGASVRAANSPYAPQAILALAVGAALLADSAGAGLRIVCQAQRCYCKSREAYAEPLQCVAPRDRLGQGFGQFIEFVVHTFHFVASLDVHVLPPSHAHQGSSIKA
jgi:hypothetical protein